ncbi:DUF202 domain-containing protein [Caenimonas soli]|uniref:DUF202 domain-containing protein n=1 Tax=Caenimonas soli TaxID=2735555 RepID=UPI0015550285|nr:DUF202 domain-containing protein [Caenimonas soli]
MISRADQGLQPQRTALAWRRTALTFLVNAVLFLRAGLLSRDTWIASMGVVALLAGALTVIYGLRRESRFRHGSVDAIVVSPAVVVAVSIGALAICLTGLCLVMRSL